MRKKRLNTAKILRQRPDKENQIELMLHGEKEWRQITKMVNKIMRKKEADERELDKRQSGK